MKQFRILIVDDALDILRTLELLLENKYEVLTAPDALSGFTKLVKYLPDLVILDIMMPKMSGYQFCDQMKKNFMVKDIPIIFLSAKNKLVDKNYGLQKGASAYISKPFENAELLNIVEELLKNNPSVKTDRPSYEQILIEETKQPKLSRRT